MAATTEAIQERIRARANGGNNAEVAAAETAATGTPASRRLRGKQHPKTAKKTAKPKVAKIKKAAKGDEEKKIWTTKPPCPCRGASPTFYKGGVIYLSEARKNFRIIRQLPNYATEASVKWVKAKPSQRTWDEALSKIDSYRA